MTARGVRANFGRYADEQTALSTIVARLKDALDPQAIWLFGSRAQGNARPDSDFDLLVVAKPGGSFGCDDYELVDRPLRDTGIGADIVPCDLDVFKASLGLKTSFVRRIVDSGRLIYGEVPA